MSDVAGARRGKKDMYANIALGSVTLSAINTLTFSQLQISVGLFQGVAMLLHRISWYPYAANLREIVAATDSLSFALTVSNRVAAIEDATDPSIIACRRLIGIAAAVGSYEVPFESDFTRLPMGGKLIPANPLFLAATSGGFGAVATVKAQIDFSFVQLGDAEYLELLQAMYPVSV